MTFCKKNRLLSVFIIVAVIATSMIFPAEASAKTTSSTYWLKVNTKQNVVNVYKKSGSTWKPYKVMLCSCGIATNRDNTTPAGTYKMKYKWRWLSLVANQSGQYCSQITGDYLFHSVPYKTKYKYSSQVTKEYNKLGKRASHGCVRLSVMDAKWIYYNCPKGTKITVYSSDKAGPLGKPTGIKVSTKKKTGWDPTDPRKGNPNYKLKKPVITTSFGTYLTIPYGKITPVLSIVKAKDPNTFRNLTSYIKVYSTKYYDKNKSAYVKSNFSSSRSGKYKITYKVSNLYCGTSYKTIYITVKPKPAPPVVPEEPQEPQEPITPEEPIAEEPTV